MRNYHNTGEKISYDVKVWVKGAGILRKLYYLDLVAADLVKTLESERSNRKNG